MVVVWREIRKIPTIPIELCGGKMRKTSKHPQFNSIRRCLPISKANTHHQLPLRSRMCSRCELNLFQQHSTEIEGISFLGSFVFSSSRLRNRRERERASNTSTAEIYGPKVRSYLVSVGSARLPSSPSFFVRCLSARAASSERLIRNLWFSRSVFQRWRVIRKAFRGLSSCRLPNW